MTRLTSGALAALELAGVMPATVTRHLPAETAQAADGDVAIRLFA